MRNQKTKYILHLDLHFRNESDGLFFDNIEEKFNHTICVQNIQGDLREKKMFRQAESCLDNILSNSSSEQLSGIIINPNLSKDSEKPDHGGFWFIHDLIRGRRNTPRYETFFSETPVLFYTDFPLTYLKQEKKNGFEPFLSLFRGGLANLNEGDLPQLNSYMSALNQSKEGLDKWLKYIEKQ